MRINYLGYDNGSKYPGTRIGAAKICESFHKRLAVYENNDNMKIQEVSINLFNKHQEAVTKTMLKELFNYNSNENILTVGGDHSLTKLFVKALNSYNRINEDYILIVFDAHLDNFKNKNKRDIYNWNFLNNIDQYFNKIIVIGYRDYYGNNDYEKLNNLEVISMDKIHTNIKECEKLLKRECINKKAYISIDFDCLDPMQFPGVSFPLVNGLLFYQLESFLDIIFSNSTVRMVDMVEYNPLVEESLSLGVINALFDRLLFKWDF